MARPISDEELQLKKRARRRLVGAIVVVTAVAVILPMVLDSEPKLAKQNVDIQIPSPDSSEFKPKAAPAVHPPASTAPLKGMPPESTTATAPKAESAPAAAKGGSSPAEPSDRAGPAAAENKEGGGAYVVQVAALADAAKVRQLQKQMTAVGLATYTEAVSTGKGQMTRVRAGPYPTREAAESARSQLKKAGLDGQVVPR